ncbi:MAG: ECF transporter S component [Erysipelotrichaceae bacterium]|nr:ECF transporter S component [Erysipelotrichaceae bacterium]
MRNARVQRISINALFLAIIMLMSFVPQIGFITIPGLVEITLIPVVVFIGAYFLPFYGGIFLGTSFGILSLIVAFIRGAGNPTVIPFQNPLVSVLPRVIVGLLASIVFNFVRKKFYHNKKHIGIALGISGFSLSIIHTILVLAMLAIVNQWGWEYFVSVITINSIIEAGLALVLVPLIGVRLHSYVPKLSNLKVKQPKRANKQVENIN